MIASRYSDIASEISGMIENSVWDDQLPGVSVLAEQFQAAPNTISKALRLLADSGKVTIQGTRGTFVSKSASGRPKLGRIGYLGVLGKRQLPSAMIDMDRMAHTRGYDFIAINYNPARAKSHSQFLHNLPVDGLITQADLTPDMVLNLRRQGKPFVSLNRISEIPGVSWVDFDNEKAVGDSLRHLLSLGHSRIAFIGFKYTIEEHQTRIRAVYDDTLRKAGVLDSRLWYGDGDSYAFFARHGSDTYRLYAEEALDFLASIPDPPTAFFVAGWLAIEVACVLAKRNIRVPEQFSIVSQTEDEDPRAGEFQLCRMVCPVRARAQKAVDILLGQLDHPGQTPIQELLPCAFVQGESAGPPPRARSGRTEPARKPEQDTSLQLVGNINSQPQGG